ncbi:6993_t:CDS:2 [Scutellospora calospora]|uniref:6993_t:CDS:1 n=1 Tax=Scutellospora calospora TaxID=85575 RepID=A0ACA9KHB5_9GLOM|nr:6993_t:CDS:2 [Scutellospora calospora]
MVLTVLALAGATVGYQRGDSKTMQKFLRFRVLAQGFTVAAAVGVPAYYKIVLSQRAKNFFEKMAEQNQAISNTEGGFCTATETPSISTLSPEVKQRIEENRRKAKAIQLEKKLQNGSMSTKQQNTESTANTTENNTESTANTTANKPEEKLRPMKKFQNYVDYDFSKMENTHGGFLLEDSEENSKKRKRRELEPEDPPINPNLSENPRCKECQTVEIDYQFHRTFHINICKTCREKFPQKYSLLTKTEAKEDYLLTDAELKDEERLPHLSRPNPHKSTWNDMMLYLREQVEEFSFEKWGGAEALDKEFEKRQNEKKKRKDKKFKTKLADLRKRTRTEELEKNRYNEHKHEFGTAVEDPKTGVSTQTCSSCGISIELDMESGAMQKIMNVIMSNVEF